MQLSGGSPLISKSPTFPSTSDSACPPFSDLAGGARSAAADAAAGKFVRREHAYVLRGALRHHWFNPWNAKWFGGFSQTTYPPFTHQWIALFSHIMGLKMAYMFVQFTGDSAAADWHVSLCRAVGG